MVGNRRGGVQGRVGEGDCFTTEGTENTEEFPRNPLPNFSL